MGQGGCPHAEVGTASSTGGASGAAVTGLAGFVTPSEPFFAGDLAGVEALSESASLSTSARVGELGGREAEVERSETEGGVGEVKHGEPVEAGDHTVAGAVPAEAGSGGQAEAESLLEVSKGWLSVVPISF